MSTLYQQLRDDWCRRGVAINPGASDEAIDRFEREHAFKLPAAFRDYVSTVNGMEDGRTDENLISFLSLEAIARELTKGELQLGNHDVPFAEFGVFSHYYVIRHDIGNINGRVCAADGTDEKQLAGSFEEFIKSYLLHPASIAHCW